MSISHVPNDTKTFLETTFLEISPKDKDSVNYE